MNINYKQSQFELFSANQENPKNPKSKALSLKIALTLENLVIFTILSIIVLLFSFSVGVERGKRLALKEFESGVQPDVAQQTASSPTLASATDQVVVPKTAKIEMPGLVQMESPAESKVAEEKEVVEKDDSQQGGYTVQVASFKLKKYALEEAETLRGKGYKAFVLKRGSYTIVCVGRFGDKKEAQRFAVPLRERYGDYLIRSL